MLKSYPKYLLNSVPSFARISKLAAPQLDSSHNFYQGQNQITLSKDALPFARN